MDIVNELILLGKVVMAAVLGGVVGMEREFAAKPAGLRTHMLVAAAAALFVMIAGVMVETIESPETLTYDPVRIIEAVVVGISFLGAGTILKNVRQGETTVEGLTTSASILMVAAIGIAVALDAFVLAVGATVLNLVINWALMYVVDKAALKKER